MWSMKFFIYTDGGARGNPGPSGAGAVIKDESGATVKELHKALGVQTNNFAEYSAVIIALDGLKRLVPEARRKDTQVQFYMDSELIARQLSGIYQIKEATLFPLYIAVHNYRVAEFPNMTFTHIPREKNKEADRLSNVAMDESEKM